MEAIVFANRHGRELKPLHEHYCPALLPVANRALLEYTLDDLKEAGIRKVRLIVGPMADAIETLIGDGKRWDLQVSYFLSHPQESPARLLPRLGLDNDSQYLFVRGDILRSPCIKGYLAFAHRLGAERLIPRLDRRSPGLWCGQPSPLALTQLAWPLKMPRPDSNSIVEVLHGHCSHFEDLSALMDTSRLLAMGRFTGLGPRGARRPSGNASFPFYVGAHSRVPGLHFQQGFGIIGDDCSLDTSVCLEGINVLGDGVIAARDVVINDSLILADSALGKGLYLKNKIVSRGLLIDPVSGGAIDVFDPALLGDSRRVRQEKVSLQSTLTGLALLGLLPLWPLAALTARALQLSLPAPLSGISKLLRGATTLFGPANVSLSAMASSSPGGEAASIKLPRQTGSKYQPVQKPGLFGPLQLGLLADAPAEEQLLVNQEFAALTGLGRAKRLWQWLYQHLKASLNPAHKAGDAEMSALLESEPLTADIQFAHTGQCRQPLEAANDSHLHSGHKAQ